MPNNFDIASLNYDETFTFSKIGKAQRNMVFKYLKPILNKNKKLSLLELNCGTGFDAITFANMRHDVIATDISEGMINVAKSKEHPKNLTFKVQDINAISESTFSTKFDLIFSNFGGFNCLTNKELKRFLDTSNTLLKANGKLILVIMPKHCLWERLYFTLKGDLKKATRRQTKSYINVNVEGVDVKTWYYNPKEIQLLTEEKYLVNNIKPIGLSIPPSYLENSFLANKVFISIYKLIDSVFTNSIWAKYSDHFFIELTKK